MTNPIRDEWLSPDGSVRLLLGDCLEILPTLDAGSISAVVTDPPYGIGYSKYESHDDDPGDYPKLIENVLPLMEKTISDGWMCVFQAAKTAPMWSQWFPRVFRLIALPKTFVQILPTLGPQWATDYALIWPIGEPPRLGKMRDWFVCETSDVRLRPKGHPCPRPLGGMVHCVEALSECGDIVLDPFMGSGTTGVACVRTGRRFIGIEIEPKYFQIAISRVKAELERFPLFEPVKKAQSLFS